MKKIQQVLDPSHANWVLGGIFQDLRLEGEHFVNHPISLPPPNSTRNLFLWILGSCRVFFSNYILFSSLTSLENYGRFPLRRNSQVIGVWFTHQEFEFSKAQRRQLDRCSYIFVHSENIRHELTGTFPNAQVIRTVGAIDVRRFRYPAVVGRNVVWVGTPHSRKNPQHLIALAEAAPHLTFKVLGKDWANSKYWESLIKLPNIEYVEINGALSSSDFDNCRIYLMLSEIEGGPMPLLESLAAGLIPICTRTGFVEDLLGPLNLRHNIVDRFDIAEILRLIESSQNSGSHSPSGINFAKKYDFTTLAKAISGAYFV